METKTKINPEGRNFKLWYAFSLAWQMGFIIAFSVGGFMLLGFAADHYLDTSPAFLLTGIFSGISLTIYEIHNMMLPLIRKNEHRTKS
jgi:hypothetical protein